MGAEGAGLPVDGGVVGDEDDVGEVVVERLDEALGEEGGQGAGEVFPLELERVLRRARTGCHLFGGLKRSSFLNLKF